MGVHYPGDVVGGLTVGAAVAAGIRHRWPVRSTAEVAGTPFPDTAGDERSPEMASAATRCPAAGPVHGDDGGHSRMTG